MAKIVDNNGYWEIKHNPISKVGVFPYTGRSISDDCEPDKIYYVYRPAETLAQSVSTWDNPPKPFINDHEMLGEGFSKIDDRPVQGVIHNPVFEDDVLYADISVYSESLKEKIEKGKKELSLGYFCKYRKEKGVYKGQAYDYIQEDMVGNHIALVDNGRCGGDVKVFDSKCTFDSLDITESFQSQNGLKKNASDGIIETEKETKDSEMADKREYIRKIMAIAAKPDSDFEGGEKEKIETIAKLLETSEYSKSEDEEELEEKEEKKALDKCGGKRRFGKDTDEEEEKKKESEAEDEDEDEEKKAEDEDVRAADVMAFLKMILEQVQALNGKKTTDEDEEEEKKESEDEDEEEEKKESEDEDEESEKADEEKQKAEDSGVIVTFAKDGSSKPRTLMDDPALRKYLGI